MYKCLHACKCVHHVCSWCPMWSPGYEIPWSWWCLCLCAVLWVLGAKPMFSVRAGCTLSHWTISLSLNIFNYYSVAITNHFRLKTNICVSPSAVEASLAPLSHICTGLQALECVLSACAALFGLWCSFVCFRSFLHNVHIFILNCCFKWMITTFPDVCFWRS